MFGKLKASQKRSEADRRGVAGGLADDGVEPRAAAELVRDPRS
jgi:predicted FMN-binding regulatory protein PaiB